MEENDDDDFDDQSLLRWKRHKMHIQKRRGKARVSSGETRQVDREPKERRRRGLVSRRTSATAETEMRGAEVLGKDALYSTEQKCEDEPVDVVGSLNSEVDVLLTSPLQVSHVVSPRTSAAVPDMCTCISLSPTITCAFQDEQRTSYTSPSHSQCHPTHSLTLTPIKVALNGGRVKQRYNFKGSSKTFRDKGQTSLLQFATAVHRSRSDSLEACRLKISVSRLPPVGTDQQKFCSVPSESVAHSSEATDVGASSSAEALGRDGRKGGPKRGSKRQCPFYKRVPETGMVVDAFSYGSIPDCPAYFLSHFHSDHYMGLSRHFQHPIYCTQVTANLVQQVLKVSPSVINPLPLDIPCRVEGVEVTLIDANHCPGSVMFLFRTASGKNYLHTGDFRFCAAMTSLNSRTIHQLFLDTTYCKPQYSFPTQQEVIEFAIRKSQEAVRRFPDTVIVSGTYTIGKERVFLALAEALDSKICITKEKEEILRCLEWPALQNLLTNCPLMASIHVLPMKKLNVNDLSAYLDSLRPVFSHVVAFLPTGWSHRNTRASLSTLRPKTAGPVTVYSIPYSEHSSFTELRQFVQCLQPQRVIPTVGNQSTPKRTEMMNYLEQWRKGLISTTHHTKQMSIDRILLEP